MAYKGLGQWFATAKKAKVAPEPDKRSAKLDPKAVHYGPAHGSQHCGSCTMYRPDGDGKTGSCTLVAGLIEADHVCDRWSPKQRNLTPLARLQRRERDACPK